MRAMRIFRMMRAVRAARAVAKLSANMDIFDAAAAGNLAMIAKKVSSAKRDDDEELDPGPVQRLILPSIRTRRRRDAVRPDSRIDGVSRRWRGGIDYARSGSTPPYAIDATT